MRFSDLIEQYNNFAKVSYKKLSNSSVMRGYELDLRQFCLYMRDPHIENIKADDINEYFNRMYELGWKPNGVMPKSIAIRNAFKYATELGLKVISHELIPIPSREYNIPHVAEDEDIMKIMQFCPKNTKNLQHIRNRCMITFLRSTGCRNSEMCGINYTQLMEHFDEKRVIIKTAKSRGVRPIRELFWDDEADDDLRTWLKAREALSKRVPFIEPEAIFVGVRGWQTGKRITNSGVAIALRKLSRKAGIKTLNAHSLRHYRGHELNDLGANNSTISGILGHASLVSSFIYTQMKSLELKRAAQKFRKSYS